MKNISSVFCICFFFLLSCKVGNENKVMASQEARELTRLEKLFLLPHDSVMNYCDLSNDSITSFPDLSGYIIKSLDLSGNLLDTLIVGFLPQKIEKLNLSRNRYKGNVYIGRNTIPSLKELDFSYNLLSRIDIGEPLYRVVLSHNDLNIITFNHHNIQYLDISYNPNIPERVDFEPSMIDTIIREGVAGGKPLISKIRIGVIDNEAWGEPRKPCFLLNRLLSLPKDSLIDSYSLSCDSLFEFPDLSNYTIKSLDLSSNYLKDIYPSYLPQKIEKLDLSYNKFKGKMEITEGMIPNLKELDLSHNKLNLVYIGIPLYKLDLSHNELDSINLNYKKMLDIDVSDNPHLKNGEWYDMTD